MSRKIIYSIIVPLYNEELVIEESYTRLKKIMDSTNENYEMVFVNDGSRDRTKEMAETICNNDPNIKLINFSRNFGHQAAITAGMDLSLGDAVVVIDADLQDPPEVILDMIKKWKEGYEVVYGKRIKREGETFLKKFTSTVYYRMIKKMATVDVPVDAGDFRLIDRKVCDALISLPEKNRYVRGLVSWLGYNQTYVEFVRQERFAGTTKYSIAKMFKLAFDGITSLSNKPLVLANYLGSFGLVAGFIILIGDAIDSAIIKQTFVNSTLSIAINLILFGITLCTIGVTNQYIGRIFDESKDRPIYIISSTKNYNTVGGEVLNEKNKVS